MRVRVSQCVVWGVLVTNYCSAPPTPSWPKVIATTFRLWWLRRVLHAADRPLDFRSLPRGAGPYESALQASDVIIIDSTAPVTASPPLVSTGPASAAAVSTAPADINPGTSAPSSQSPVRTRSGITVVRIGFAAALVVVLAAAGVSAFALARGRVDHGGTRSAAAQRATAGALAAAAADREQAAAWITAQVSHAEIVACDPLMCATLQQRGFPAADLAPVGPGTGDPLGSGIVVSTAATRSLFGTRLAKVYAPVIIASFGTGSSLVQVRVTAMGGAASYLSAEQADLAARKMAGAELLRNAHVHVAPLARQQLAAGQVDSRLLITLAALAARLPVQVTGFSDAGPGAAPITPLRLMTISAGSPSYINQVLAFLRAQRAPLLAVTTVAYAGTDAVIQIEFTAPSPPGLLGSGGQS